MNIDTDANQGSYIVSRELLDSPLWPEITLKRQLKFIKFLELGYFREVNSSTCEIFCLQCVSLVERSERTFKEVFNDLFFFIEYTESALDRINYKFRKAKINLSYINESPTSRLSCLKTINIVDGLIWLTYFTRQKRDYFTQFPHKTVKPSCEHKTSLGIYILEGSKI